MVLVHPCPGMALTEMRDAATAFAAHGWPIYPGEFRRHSTDAEAGRSTPPAVRQVAGEQAGPLDADQAFLARTECAWPILLGPDRSYGVIDSALRSIGGPSTCCARLAALAPSWSTLGGAGTCSPDAATTTATAWPLSGRGRRGAAPDEHRILELPVAGVPGRGRVGIAVRCRCQRGAGRPPPVASCRCVF
jgi:hypothetical protein